MPSHALAAADWVVVGAYFGVLVVTGILLSRRQSGTEDYYLAGRRMPAWAVAISVLATALSAATFIGGPQFAYAYDLTYLVATIGTILAALLCAFFFLPAYYRHNVTTVYDLLAHRFGPGARTAGSLAFMGGRLLASGARIYIAAHALAWILFQDLDVAGLVAAIWILTAAGVLYTIAGGIATVIWTDVVQTVIFIAAVLAAFIFLLRSIDIPLAEAIDWLNAEEKLHLLDTSMDHTASYTLWTALIAWTLFNLAAYATDQDLVQRLLTCRTRARASASMIVSSLIGVPVTLLFMTIGLLLFVRHNHPDLTTATETVEHAPGIKVFLSYITTDMPAGLGGLMIAGLFAAGLSSLDSALNALSSTFVNDIYARIRPRRDKTHDLLIARISLIGWGTALGVVATGAIFWQRASGDDSLINFALSVMTYAYAGLLAVFATALFTRRGNTLTVIGALVAGALAVLCTEPALWAKLEFKAVEPLAFPWRFTLGSLVAFAVCIVLPSQPDGRNDPEKP